MDLWNRRDVLRAAAVGTVGAAAGCTAESAAFRADAPEYDDQDPEPYTRFMGATGAASETAFYLAPSRLADALPSAADPVVEGLRRNIEWSGLAFEDVDHFVATGLGTFLVGDFRRSTAKSALADAQAMPEEAAGGDYEVVYGTPMSPVLVGDGAVVSLSSVAGAQAERRAVDSLYGDWDGTVAGLERDESVPSRVRRVAEAVGAPPVAAVGGQEIGSPGLGPRRPVPPDESVGTAGVGWTVGERFTTGRVVFDYPDGTPDTGAVENRYAGERGDEDRGDGYLGGVKEFADRTVRADESTLRVQGEIETKRFDLLHRGDPVRPNATFVFEYGDGETRVTHDGDDPIAGTNLTVTADGRPLPGGFHETYRRRYVTEGDSVTVSVESDTTVRVRWTPSVTREPEVSLGSFDIP
jgi:hypothetical protein